MRLMTTALFVLVSCGALCAPASAQGAAPGDTDSLQARRLARMERDMALGYARANAGHHTLAVAHFEDAMRAHPAAAAPYLALGRTFALLGRRADAIAALQAGRRHAPDGVALVLALADALAEDGQARAALALLRAATQRHDGLAILEARGRLARELGAWSEAADAYAAVVDLSRRDDTVPPESVRQAELLLAAIAILLNDEHPRARACATAARAAEGARSRWTRALAGCTPP